MFVFIAAISTGWLAHALDFPELNTATVQFRDLTFEFERRPQASSKKLPSGNHYVLYSSTSVANHGLLATHFQITEAGSIQDAKALLEKERRFAQMLKREEELAESLTLGGYPSVLIVTRTSDQEDRQRTAIMAMLIDGHIVKVRIVGHEGDITPEIIEALKNKLVFG